MIQVRQALMLLTLVAGLFGINQRARAEATCPFAMWPSHGSCCDLGYEYVASKQRCMQVRPERRCVAGHLDSCVDAGHDLEARSALGATYAAEFYRYACDEGYSPACRDLAGLYDRGVGVKRDRRRALQLWEDACAHGDARSCTILAHALFGASQTTGQVMELLRIGCHRGDAFACGDYARRLSSDPEQTVLSARYYERACQGGVGEACLSLIEHERRLMAVDPLRERELTRLACQGGERQSCVVVGRFDALIQVGVEGTAAAPHLPLGPGQ